MARYGKRGIGDFIPARGEAEVTARLKGAYGGKKMSYGKRRRFSRNSTKNPESQFKPGSYGNVNWDDSKPNLIWRSNAGDAVTPIRLLSFNADSVAADENQPQAFLKRINLQLAFISGLGQARVSDALMSYGQAERDDIPPMGGDYLGTINGALLSGRLDNSTLVGPTSWMEGMPVQLFMIYETLEEANEPLSTALDGTIEQVDSLRNKRFFWRRLICPTAYNPTIVNIKKSFPGAGVRVSQGEREIYQVTLGCQGYTEMGSSVFPTLTMVTGENRWWYFKDKP